MKKHFFIIFPNTFIQVRDEKQIGFKKFVLEPTCADDENGQKKNAS